MIRVRFPSGLVLEYKDANHVLTSGSGRYLDLLTKKNGVFIAGISAFSNAIIESGNFSAPKIIWPPQRNPEGLPVHPGLK